MDIMDVLMVRFKWQTDLIQLLKIEESYISKTNAG